MELNGFDEMQAARALDALTEYIEKTRKNGLIEEGQSIDLQVGMKKIPDTNKKIKISLPHSLYTAEDELCLFVKDVNEKDHEETKRHFEDAMKAKGITNIAEVIPLRQIKTEYKEFEAKRNLSRLYSLFLADARIIRLLPGFLGKAFYKGKRMPEQVNMEGKDLQEEVRQILHSTCCHIKGRGPSCQVRVGSTNLNREENLANIRAAIQAVVEGMPGGAANVKSLYLRSQNSPALAIFITFGSADDVVLPLPDRKKEKSKAEDVTPVEGAKIIAKGNADFKVVKTRKSKAKKAKKSAQTNSVKEEERKASESDIKKTPRKSPTVKDAKRNASEADVENAPTKGKRKASESEVPAKSPTARKAKRKASESEVPAKSPTARKAKRKASESEVPAKSPTAKKANGKASESEVPAKSPTPKKGKRKVSEGDIENTPVKTPTRKGKRKASESDVENTPQRKSKASRK